MKIVIGVAFLGLFGTWAYLEFVAGSHEGLKDALFWAAMVLVVLTGVEFRPRRRTGSGD